jgi:hypothetical protein
VLLFSGFFEQYADPLPSLLTFFTPPLRWSKHLWVFASYFWPRKGIKHDKLKAIYARVCCLFFRTFFSCLLTTPLTSIISSSSVSNKDEPSTASASNEPKKRPNEDGSDHVSKKSKPS